MKWLVELLRLFQRPAVLPPVVLAVPASPERVVVESTTHLSANFTVLEFERSATAAAKNIPNKMDDRQREHARLLCTNVLQPARDHFGVSIKINSGFRSATLNADPDVRGSNNSDHLYGKAADIKPTGAVTLRQLGKWIQDNCQFKQLILEHDRWIHVSYDPADNRNEILEAYYVTLANGKQKTKYRRFRFG